MTCANFKGAKRLGANWQGGEMTYIHVAHVAEHFNFFSLEVQLSIKVLFAEQNSTFSLSP